MTISQLDESIIRPNGKGTSAKTGHVAFLVAAGRDYDADILSKHRTSRGAIAAAKDGCRVWMWDSYMGTAGGFRIA